MAVVSFACHREAFQPRLVSVDEPATCRFMGLQDVAYLALTGARASYVAVVETALVCPSEDRSRAFIDCVRTSIHAEVRTAAKAQQVLNCDAMAVCSLSF